MNGRRLIGRLCLFGVLLLCAAGVTASAGVAPKATVYVYTTKIELIMLRDGEVIVREPLPYDYKYLRPVATLDDLHVVAIKDGPSEEAEGRLLIVVDTSSGEVRRLPCPYCTSAAPAGGGAVLVSQQQPYDQEYSFGSLLKFDLRTDHPPLRLVPQQLESLSNVLFLSGLPGEVLVVGVDKGHIEKYFLLRPDGSVELVHTRDNYKADSLDNLYLIGFGPRAAARTSDGKSLFAINTSFKRPYPECGETAHVLILSTGKPESIEADLSPLMPAGGSPEPDVVTKLIDLWWGQDGLLHSTLAAWRCGEEGSEIVPTEWRYSGGTWEQVSPDFKFSARDIGQSRKLELAHGVLELDEEGRRTRVAESVMDIILPRPWSDGVPTDQCLLGIIDDLGTRVGDIDGDEKPDQMSLVQCKAIGEHGQQSLVVKIGFGSGIHLNQVVSTSADGYASGWLGITDINGDKRSEIVFTDSGGAHSRHVVTLEYKDNSLVLLRGDLTEDQPMLDSSITTNAGFTCQAVNGRAQLVTWGVGLDDSTTPPQYSGDETTFQADDSGAMRKIDERKVEYAALPDGGGGYEPPSEVNDRAGAHCPGLDAFPR